MAIHNTFFTHHPRRAGAISWLVALGVFLALPVFGQTNLAPASAGASLRAALVQKTAELDAQEATAKQMAKVHVVPVSTNAGPQFRVDRYEVAGNTLLSPGEVAGIFTNVPAAFGTNVAIDAILAAAGDLQAAYRERGYMTVVVGLPPQKITNAAVQVKVTEARLVAIKVAGDDWRHYYSSNNVMRALPSLHTNMMLNAKVFQRELDQANMSRDRQIYPVVGPGPEPGTSELTLTVKDRLPWHARLEVNNDQATPGTPQLRANFSSQCDNLWDLEHEAGLQYSMSIEQLKGGKDYVMVPMDEPQVANYSGYYRLPLGGYSSVQDQVNANPGRFGYNEATHQFNLPPPAGRPELTIFASRAVSDTGIQRGSQNYLVDTTTNVPGVGEFHPLSITTNSAGESVTLNEDIGLKMSMPLPRFKDVSTTLSFGIDYKHFEQTGYNTNENNFVIQYPDQQGNLQTVSTYAPQPLPSSYNSLDYFPFNIGLNGSVPDKFGTTYFNATANFNVLKIFSGTSTQTTSTNITPTATNIVHGTSIAHGHSFSGVAYSPEARSDYLTLQFGADRVQTIYKDWTVKLHADGQWANSPLIGNEQYSLGGTSGVRGYDNGQAYGDTGWRMMIEPQLPPIEIGMFGDETSGEVGWLRSSVFMDYGETYLLAPQAGSSGRQQFWGAGWAAAVSIGSHVDGRISMAWPLLTTGQTKAGSLHLYFGVGGQF